MKHRKHCKPPRVLPDPQPSQIVRRVLQEGWDGKAVVRFDVKGEAGVPDLHIYMLPEHPLAALQVGDRLTVTATA